MNVKIGQKVRCEDEFLSAIGTVECIKQSYVLIKDVATRPMPTHTLQIRKTLIEQVFPNFDMNNYDSSSTYLVFFLNDVQEVIND